MSRRRWTDEQLRQAVASSKTIADVLRKLNLSTRPGNYPTIRKHINRLNLDITHFSGRAQGIISNDELLRNNLFLMSVIFVILMIGIIDTLF